KRLKTEQADDASAARMMLISDYPEAQQAAVEAGALPGFGKSHIADAKTRQRITDAIAGL
ncbi:MAG: hypothetical protein ACPGYV_09000, partial [Phycisphaeraceae bacterium]